MVKTVPEEEINNQLEYIEKIKKLGLKKTYFIITMGCKLNENDSEKIAGMLTGMGFDDASSANEADIVVYNTCSIRENAEEKVFGKLGELKKRKEENGTIICFAGCMSQEPHVVEKIKKSYNQVDILFGTHNIYKFPEMLYKKLLSDNKFFEVWDIDGEIWEGLPIKRLNTKSASVTIMNGCNNFCSYCIVPYTRGRERSRKPEDIIEEIKTLAKEGYKEIILLGQNVNSYKGRDDYNFADLLRDVDKIDGIDIVRFMSPHPKDFKDDVIDAIAECSSVCKVIHLPLQSGSTSILKSMNRGYTKEQYLELVDKIRKKVPNVAFTTDIIVGFPGETEEDFEDTLDIVKRVGYEQVFMFIYSVRKGTRAEKMNNHIPEEIKSRRFARLKELSDGLVEKENKKYIGTIQRILVEGESKTNSEVLTGRTETGKIVNFIGDKKLIGETIDVKIVSQHVWYFEGKILRRGSLKNMIKVTFNNNSYDVEEDTRVKDFLDSINIDMENIIACKVFNEVKSLDFQLHKDCKVELIDYTSSDGNRIYIRGLTFILIKAFEELYPDIKLTVNYSLGHSIYCELHDGAKLTQEMTDRLKMHMNKIVENDLPFEKKILMLEEAKKLYKNINRDDKVGLLDNRMKSHVSMYYCGNTFNYFYGVMPISTRYLKYFDIIPYENGLLLVYPRRSNPTKLEQIINTKKLYATFDEYDKLHRILGVENVAGLNKCIQDGKIEELIRVSEALHEKKIAQIAENIANDRKKKIILIAGPSSSGKTTFAQRLGVQLKTNGINAVTLSMDNYFVNRADTPKNENGEYDFECLEAIDVNLFNEQLSLLLSGEEISLPTFDFTDGSRKYLGNKAKLGENEVLVVEGIHGLNEALTASIPREFKYKIYISALTALNIDDYNRISTTDSRLLRRILRDSKYRSHFAEATIKMWPSVRNGEEKYIFPYQEEADVIFNSSLVYEISALKTFVEPLLVAVSHDNPEFSEAKRLYEFLGYFLPIEVDNIPLNSILREFIGGGCFYR